MKYQLKVYSIWEDGQRKDALGLPHQEDSLYPPFDRQTDADRLFILCDGMGGHDAGEVASAAVCEAMSNAIRNDGHDADGSFTDADLADALADAYRALDLHDTGASKKMGTTMTLLKLHNEGATIAHIGDSRVYHIRPGQSDADTRILFVTEDHSLVNSLIKVGELTHEQARHSKQKNIITRAMQPGADNRCKADVYHTADIRPGDYFFLCSDGMLEEDDMEDGTVIRRIFSAMVDSDEERTRILRGATAGNRDNHTAIIVHILQVEDEAEKPSDGELKTPDETRPEPLPSVSSQPSATQPVATQPVSSQPAAPESTTRTFTIQIPSHRQLLFVCVALVVLVALLVGIFVWMQTHKGDVGTPNPQPIPDPVENIVQSTNLTEPSEQPN